MMFWGNIDNCLLECQLLWMTNTVEACEWGMRLYVNGRGILVKDGQTSIGKVATLHYGVVLV